jgi:hypothetical protein
MDLSRYGPSINPLAAALAAGGPPGGASPMDQAGSPASGMPGGGASPMGGGMPSIPGLPPGVMPMPPTGPRAPITPTGVPQLPGAIAPGIGGTGQLPPQQQLPFGFGMTGGGY